MCKYTKVNEEESILFKKKIKQNKSKYRILSYIYKSCFALDMPKKYGYKKVRDRYYNTHNYNARVR